MEIKTGKQIHDFFESSMSPDSFSKPPIEFYQNQKWVAINNELLQTLKDGFSSWDEAHRTLTEVYNALTKTQAD